MSETLAKSKTGALRLLLQTRKPFSKETEISSMKCAEFHFTVSFGNGKAYEVSLENNQLEVRNGRGKVIFLDTKER